MHNNSKLVSVGIGSFNNAKFIVETLDSINSQDYDNIELIIIDDCSSDDSVAIINKWLPQSRFPTRFIINEQNIGITKICNKLLDNVSPASEYIALIGSDDIMKRNRLSIQVELLSNTDETVVAALSDMEIIDEKGDITLDSYFKHRNETRESMETYLAQPSLKQVEQCIRSNFFPSPSMIYKTAIMKKIGGWDESLFFEDWEMMLRLISKGYKFVVSDDRLIEYRKTQTSVTVKPNKLYIESILELCYRYRSINKQIDLAVNEKINEYAFLLYQLGAKKSSKWMFRKLCFEFKPSTFYYWFMSSLGMSYNTSVNLKRGFRKKYQ